MTPALPDPVRATVIAGPRSVDYLTAGSGSPVILFVREPSRHGRVADLSRFAKVICPILEEIASEDGLDWLNDFLDGLGLEQVVAMIDDSCALMAASLQDRAGHRFVGVLRGGDAFRAIDTASTPASLAAADPEP